MSWDEIIKGGSGNDVLSGGSGDDFLQGKAGGDTLDGESGDDQLHGDAGDDHVRGGSGNDLLHGGLGTDRAYYSGSVLEYSFARDGDNFFVSHSGGSMIDGYDRLISIERLVFADAVIDLTRNNAPVAFNDSASTDEDAGSYSGPSVLANDFDWENDNLTAVPGSFAGVYGTLVLNSDGTYTYTPYASAQALALGQSVQDSFTYTVTDGSLSDTGTLTITVAGRNDAPVANPDSASTGENSAVSIAVLANDSDVDSGAVLTVTGASAPAGQGSVSVVANQLVFDPGTDFDHLDSGESAEVLLSYSITDEHGATSSSTVTVTVNGSNDAPVANDDNGSTGEDAAVSGNVLANDTDVDGETLTVANPGTYVGAYGTLTLAADGSYTYVPGAAAQGLDDGEVASDSFAYTASDGTASDSAVLTITVAGANDAPIANDDSASTSEESAVSGSVLANDSDVDGEVLTVANPGTYVGAYGTLILAADGSYTYTPGAAAQELDDGEVASDSFAYTASDGTTSDSAVLTVTIAGANDAPIADDDSAATGEDAAVSGNVLGNDSDIDGETLSVTNPGTYVGAYGTLTLAADGSYTYVPGAAAQGLDDGEVASDSFVYTASDGTASDSAVLTITVAGANDAPIANDDSAVTGEESAVSGSVLANDSDVDGETLTVTNPGTYVGAYGTLVLAADGSYTYTPGPAAQGLDDGEVASDSFAYTASDGTASDSAVLTVTVSGANDAPVANDDNASTGEDAAVSGNVLANDSDVDGESLTVANPGTYVGAYGTLILAADGSYTYTPGSAAQGLDDGEVAGDSFAYTASDGTDSDSAVLTITVAGANDAPVANDDSAATSEDAGVSGNVLANDSDVDGDVLTVANPGTYVGAFGTLTLAADGSYSYAPGAAAQSLAAGEVAQDSFVYIASDGTASDSATLTVSLTGVNDAPTIDSGGTVASGSVAELPNDSPGENLVVHEADGVVAFDDVDLSDTHSATATAQSANYLGTFTLDPVDQAGDSVAWHFDVSDSALDGLEEGEVVTQTYTITIDDGHGGTTTQDVTITLTGASDGAGPPWYIDNSAVGSTNVGSQANPFTSIAAFNAAQGMAGGPAAGDQVFLLAGTGIYAEADGINLLDGQILTGIGDPTIAPTAGDGVNVGEDNSLSGINIVSGAGAGIADDGGSVGALSVSDVDIITTSGVGIDIGGGGAGVSIAGSTIAAGSNYAILGANVAGFTLSDSVVSSGSASAGTVAFTNLSGTANLLGNVLNGGSGDTLGIVNSSGSLALTISDSAQNGAVIGPNHSATGDDGVSILTTGDATLALTVEGVEFQGARSDLLQVTAEGNSSQDLIITDNDFANGQGGVGGGVLLTGGGAGSDITVDFRVEDNSFSGAVGTALAAIYGQQAGQVRGHIEGNAIGTDDEVADGSGSLSGGGIFVSLEKAPGAGDASFTVSILDNDVNDIDGFAAIELRSNGGGASNPAVLEATVTGNRIGELGDFAFAGLLAQVGGSALDGDFAELGLDLDGNVIDASGADYGGNAVYLQQVSSDSHFYFPGYSGSSDGEYLGGTASADLNAFFAANGNAMANGGYPAFPGGVDAGLIMGSTGDSFVHPVWP